MTISDEERRAVALRLRSAKYGWHSWERALYDALGVDTETAGLDMLDRLADLIEPGERACHYYDSETNRCGCYDTRLVDRDALLELADEIDNPLRQAVWNQTPGVRREHIMSRYARRIRGALGVER